MKLTDTGIEGVAEFPPTHWSLLGRLRDPEATGHAEDLERLVQQYWKPVYCVIRFAWTRGNDDAKDLTQEFFATHIFDGSLTRTARAERGSFRSLLKASLANFMRKQLRDAGRQKRGGDVMTISMAAVPDVDDWLPDAKGMTPEQAFDAVWNHSVTTRALALLEERLRNEGKAQHFEILRRYDLDDERASLSYADIAVALGLSADQVRHALAQTRTRLRDILVEVVGDTVTNADDLADELRSLFTT